MPSLKSVLQSMLRPFDLAITRNSTLEHLRMEARSAKDIQLLSALPKNALQGAIRELPNSQSQLRQDIFVLSELGFKSGGFFVEFGATDGLTLSNTWLLEKKFGWTGILAEPGRVWQERLLSGRSAAIDFDCVWSSTGEELEFIETQEAELSTIADHKGSDGHAGSRSSGKRYKVKTVSLNDLLARHNAPARMDYLSIDTEGSELDILSALDFERYRFSTITCEHNYTPNRDRLHSLLTGKGYVRKLEHISQFDDWYVYSGKDNG